MAFSLISHTAAGSTNGGVSVVTGGITTTGANLIVVSVSYYATVATLTDSKSNTWTSLSTFTGSSFYTVLYYCYAPTVGAGHTFTFSGVTNYPVISVAAFSGAASSPFDQQNGSSTLSTGSITPTVANELVVSGLTCSGSVSSINAGMTISDSLGYASGQSVGGGLAYIIQTAASAISPTWTATGSATASGIASFKSGAAAATPLPPSLFVYQAINRSNTF